MAQFQYYIPEGRENTARDLAPEAGLDHVLSLGRERGDLFTLDCGDGPDGGRGVILRPETGCRYDPDHQRWERHPTEGHWIGYDPADLPGPEDLEREEWVAEYAVELGDGHRWKIPTAAGREPQDCPLPKDRRIDMETGKIVSRPEPRFDQLRLYAAEIREAALREGQMQIDAEKEFRVCMEAIRTNYWIGGVEASVLGLFSDVAVQGIFWRLIGFLDWPEAQEALAALEAGEEG